MGNRWRGVKVAKVFLEDFTAKLEILEQTKNSKG